MTNQALQIAHKHLLWSSIRQFGQLWHEEPEFIAEYGKYVYNLHKQSLPDAIECFGKLVEQGKLIAPRLANKSP
jgi:hypothetical protein